MQLYNYFTLPSTPPLFFNIAPPLKKNSKSERDSPPLHLQVGCYPGGGVIHHVIACFYIVIYNVHVTCSHMYIVLSDTRLMFPWFLQSRLMFPCFYISLVYSIKYFNFLYGRYRRMYLYVFLSMVLTHSRSGSSRVIGLYIRRLLNFF